MKKNNGKASINRTAYEQDLKKHLKNREFRESFYKEKILLEIAVDMLKERKNRHLSQRQLAVKAGMKQQVIARLENGTQNATVETLLRVAKGLDKELKISFC